MKLKGRWLLTAILGVLISLVWCLMYLYTSVTHKTRLERLFVSVEQMVLHYSNHSKSQQMELQPLVAITNSLSLRVEESQPRPSHSQNRTTSPRKIVHTKMEFKLVESVAVYRDICGEVHSFLVFVHSHPSNRGRRNIIRETWASAALPLGGVVIFILGMEFQYKLIIQKEAQENGDILQYDFTDNYRNLVYKSIMSLKFTQSLKCSSLKYIVKTDDDVCLNLKRIKDILKSLQNHTNLLVGSQASNNNVQRSGKWRVPQALYPGTTFPDHLSGSAYVLSMDTVCKLADLSETAPVIPVEDVFITGILAEKAGIRPIARQDFPTWLRLGPRAECDYTRGRVVGLHGCLSRRMKELWSKLSSGAVC